MVAFAAKFPGHIVALDVDSEHAYLVHRDGWIFGTEYVSPSVGFQQSLGGALFGEKGFVLQRPDGQGIAWIELGGELVRYDLAPSQELLVPPRARGWLASAALRLAMITGAPRARGWLRASVRFEITRLTGIADRWAGGDGHWLVRLQGPGTVWSQSMPLPVLTAALAPLRGAGRS